MEMYDTKTKTLTKRVLGGSSYLLVSDQGDLSDYDTTVWRGDKRARRWVSVPVAGNRAKANVILGADSLKLDKDDVLARNGAKTTRIQGEPVQSAIKVPEGPSFTLHSWRGENRNAFHALYSTVDHDRTLPLLANMHVKSENGAVTAITTDRYRATRAVLETVSKKVNFTALVPRQMLREITYNRAWHLTVWEGASMVEFCETGVRLQMLNYVPSENGYPDVEYLFANYSEEHAQWTVTPSMFAKTVRDMNPGRHSPIALSRDGLIGAEGAGHLYPAGVVNTDYKGEPSNWVALNHVYLAQMMKALSLYPEVKIEWNEEMKTVNILASERVRMLLMPTRGAGRSFPVVDIVEW